LLGFFCPQPAPALLAHHLKPAPNSTQDGVAVYHVHALPDAHLQSLSLTMRLRPCVKTRVGFIVAEQTNHVRALAPKVHQVQPRANDPPGDVIHVSRLEDEHKAPAAPELGRLRPPHHQHRRRAPPVPLLRAAAAEALAGLAR
jgi:hypothetical protein